MQHDWENVERGLYKVHATGQYYERIRSKTGGDTWQSLYTAKITEGLTNSKLDHCGLTIPPVTLRRVNVVDILILRTEG
jgi:hypothetical protein